MGHLTRDITKAHAIPDGCISIVHHPLDGDITQVLDQLLGLFSSQAYDERNQLGTRRMREDRSFRP